MILPFPSSYPGLAAAPRALEETAEPTLQSLYEAHARQVAEVAYRLMGNDRDLDDVVQETFLDVSENLESRDRELPVRAWVLMLAVRRVRRLFAKRRRFRLFGFRWLEATPKVNDPRGKEKSLDLYEALSSLSEDLRIPFCLHRIEQLTLPETAQACEVSLATVKRRIAEAEERLSRRLEP